jgi:hypothetical protein
MRTKTTVMACAALVVVGLALAACDQNEQGRIRNYEPGTYLGQPDTPLTKEQRDALRQRARAQSGG